MTKQAKIGISFSGGGTRGAAHIGVIQALNEHGIQADFVAGTSAGAIVGALYAAGLSVERMMDFAGEGKLFKLFQAKLPTKGLISLDYLGKLMDKYIDENSFEGLKLPLHVVASNLMSGHPETFNSGKLFEVIMASCAIPLIFKPVEIDQQIYVDGGIFDNMPVNCLKPNCDIIIGVNLIPITPLKKKNLKSLYSIGMRSFDMHVAHNSQMNFPLCDVVIEPTEVKDFSIFNFGAYKKMHQYGYEAAMLKMDDLLALVESK